MGGRRLQRIGGTSHAVLRTLYTVLTLSRLSPAVNNLNTNDYDSSDDDLPPPASTLTPPPAGTPSKKAAARKRAQLRKKGSQLDLNGSGDGKGGNDSDVSVVDAAASAIPPIPALPSKAQLQEKANGVKEVTYAKAAEVTESVSKSQPVKAAKEQAGPLVKQASIAAETAKQQAAAAVPKVQKFVEEKVEQVKAALPKEAPYVPLVTSAERPPAPESVSSDEEEEPAFEDDDEEEDEEEEVAPSSAVAKAASPTPASPRPAYPSVSPSGATPAPKGTYTGADHDPNKKIKAIIQRTVWGLVMGAGFLVFVAAGHAYVVALVFIIQAVVFKELTGLFDAGYSGAHIDAQGQVTRSAERLAKRQGRKEERERWSRRMAWFVFFSFLFPSTLTRLAQVLLRRRELLPLWRIAHLLLKAHPHPSSFVPSDRLFVRSTSPPRFLRTLHDRFAFPFRLSAVC